MLHPHKIRIQIAIVVALLLISVGVQAQSGLSDRQKERLKSTLIEMKQKTERERNTLRRARKDLFMAYQSYGLDARKVKSLQEQISDSQLKLLNINLENQISLRHILTEPQFAEFQKMMKREMGGDMVMPDPGDAIHDKYPDSKMVNDLKLNSDQRKRIQPLIGPGAEKMKVIESLRKNARQMIEIYSRYSMNSAEAKKIISAIHEDQKDLASLNLKRQQSLRKVLTKDQFTRLASMISQKMREHQDHGHGHRRR